jgi:signal transduction histidine kinase
MAPTLSGKQFHRRLRNLILVAWIVPPFFGLSFLLYIDLFTTEQMLEILDNPMEPLFNLGWVVLAAWYLPRILRPVCDYLDNPQDADESKVLGLLRNFPLYYWGAFCAYLILAPTSVMFSAMHYSDYIATPIDWFRIHLVALIVSIIVGLPIFFLILDLFGLAAGRLPLNKPHVTLKTKVFMIGALVPLLIDTMLVQYYWTRTGYFKTETFFVWLTLELLAICGSFIFVRSIGQSLSPLQKLIEKETELEPGRLSMFVAKSTDELGVIATDYRHLLEELYAHRHELEIQVQSRTQELISINKELEAFAYSVSHDLRAPLRSINGFSHILLDNYAFDLDEEARSYVQRIVDSSARMSQIIDALLRLSRVTRSGLEPEHVDLTKMAGSIFEQHKQDKHERVIEIRILPGLSARADKNLTHILLENLLSNALKFSSHKTHCIIEFGQTTVETQSYFYIRDNGAGFDMRFADKLFTAFQRLHPQQEFEGAGIGLATVQRIINLHGGRIWAEAKPDEGATFYFSLSA